MLLSLKWLQNYVDLKGIKVNELAEKITLSGIEVEKVSPLSKATNCVIGHVLDKTKHPQADKLNICQVDLGDETTQIVCGAPNVDKGQKVVVSKVGAILPGGIKIKKAKLRGVESNGMICSLKELGIEKSLVPQEFQDGIMVLDKDAPIGSDAIKYLGLDDTVLELGLTPNRSDCLSIIGNAYEVSAILDKEIKMPYGQNVPFSKNKNFNVKLNSDDCLLYYAKKITNIKIKPSPLWMQQALIASGIRPISNVVDITNYVMLELGQPLHAFDYNKLNSREIVVRNARKGEKIVTLDDNERDLIETDLLITDGKNPVALAGVMGGLNTEIDDNTTEVLLESAVFKPITIRKTYTRLGLRSEASIRYEKQVDPNRTLYALNRACELLVELADGKIDNHLSMASNYKEEERLVKISLEKINHVLGIEMKEKDVIDVFRRLKFDFVALEGSFVVTVPTRRPDITIQEDLIEEIIRIYGYHHLNHTLPVTNNIGGLTDRQKKIRKIKQILLANGLNEVITYSLINEKDIRRFNHHKDLKQFINLDMPMSEEHGVLRIGLINSLLKVVNYNNARNINDVLVFEIAKSYTMENDEPHETTLLSGVLTGTVYESKWQKEKETVDFFFTKGILEEVFEHLNVEQEISFVPVNKNEVSSDFHPMRTATILLNDKKIGIIGEVHPNVEKEFDLKETYVFEIELDSILNLNKEENTFKPISKYPTMTRDIAIVVNQEISAQELKNAIIDKGKNILKTVEIFDVYQGEHIEEDKKSIAFSLTFENMDKTLTDDEVNTAYDRIIKHLEKTYQANLRK